MSKEPTTSVEFKISSWTIIKIVAMVFALWLVFLIRDILAMVLVALIFALIIAPAADWFEKKKIPRSIGVLIIYIIFFSLLALSIGIIVPPLVSEVKELTTNFSYLWGRITESFAVTGDYAATSPIPKMVEKNLSALEAALTRAVGSAFSVVTGFFGGIFSFIVILVIAFYMIVQGDTFKKLFYNFIPEKRQVFIVDILAKIQKKISLWARGQIILIFAVGLISFIGLKILGVKYALALGIFAGITEFIPYAGPFIGGTVAVFFALAQSPLKAFLVVILYILIQQLENNILTPKVMQRVVGVNPIMSIIALLIGFRLAGIPGAIFAIPIFTALDIAVRGFFEDGWKEEGS